MSTEERGDPESLLKAIQKNERKKGKGRLKIFLGMGAGVGKTCAMLETAGQEAKKGVNLIIATVDTHGRLETEKLLAGLTRIPERVVIYRVPGTTSTGLGLGLAIVSSVASIHQGKMRVQNRRTGGAKFFLILPYTVD